MSALKHMQLSLVRPSISLSGSVRLHVSFMVSCVKPFVHEFDQPNTFFDGDIFPYSFDAPPAYGATYRSQHCVLLVIF